jgi:hypothetical protein
MVNNRKIIRRIVTEAIGLEDRGAARASVRRASQWERKSRAWLSYCVGI